MNGKSNHAKQTGACMFFVFCFVFFLQDLIWIFKDFHFYISIHKSSTRVITEILAL